MANKRTYLVTGAAGYLGSEVCRQLLEQNESVRAFVLPNDPAIQYIPKDVEIVEGDLRDKASLETFFHVDADTETVVLHCVHRCTRHGDAEDCDGHQCRRNSEYY